MKIELLHYTPLDIAIKAIRMCYRSEGKSDSQYSYDRCIHKKFILGERDKELIKRIIKSGHTSTTEHISYSYQIEEISRVTLAQLTRHRIASYSVESQRYVNQSESLKVVPSTIANTIFNNKKLNELYADVCTNSLYLYQNLIKEGVPKEDARYILPQGITTNLIMTINARSLRNFFKLRLDPKAQWEIQSLAYKMYKILPPSHKDTLFYDIKLKEDI